MGFGCQVSCLYQASSGFELLLDSKSRVITTTLRSLLQPILAHMCQCCYVARGPGQFSASIHNDDDDRMMTLTLLHHCHMLHARRYVSGDFRFRSGYCRSNPRKMVKTWAEKEMRNLARLRAAGIPAPAPLLLRLHVLVMEFVGEDGVAAPRLKVSGWQRGHKGSGEGAR